MIPKIIHFIWFGPNKISPLTSKCIESWEKYLHDFTIMKWREEDFKDDHRIQVLLRKKQWAFASDLARLRVLNKYGGIYLDADMELVKDCSHLVEFDAFVGFESEDLVANGIMGTKANHWLGEEAYTLSCGKFDRFGYLDVSPVIITETLSKHRELNPGNVDNVMLFTKEVFYPYNPYDSSRNLKQLMYSSIEKSTLGIHHYQKSWKRSAFSKLSIYIRNRLKKLKNVE